MDLKIRTHLDEHAPGAQMGTVNFTGGGVSHQLFFLGGYLLKVHSSTLYRKWGAVSLLPFLGVCSCNCTSTGVSEGFDVLVTRL